MSSSTYDPGYPVSGVNDGDRDGFNAGAGGYWNDVTNSKFPDWVQVTFNGPQTIGKIDVFTLQDAYTTPVDPTLDTMFTLYGITDFDVQYWTGTAWATVPGGSITGNRHVWTQITFPAITTDRIRVVINSAVDMWSRIMEIEAWSPGSSVAAATMAA